MTNFILGCANFFYRYGIKNGLPLSNNINNILETAIDKGITNLDTALIYENNEVEFQISKNLLNKIEVGTKIVLQDIDLRDNNTIDKLLKELQKSLNLWSKDQFKYIYCHETINSKENLEKWLFLDDIFKKNGLCKNTGISIYSLEDLHYFQSLKVDRIQFPDNLYWQKKDIFINEVKKLTSILDVRSIFLQGILVNSPKKILGSIPQDLLLHHTKIWNEFNCSKNKLYEICLTYIKSKKYENIVFGVENKEELVELVDGFKNANQFEDFSNFEYKNNDIDPRTWKK